MQAARFVWAEAEPLEVERDLRSGGVTGIHPAAEGSVYLSANTPRFWKALCELTGLPELAADPAYDTVRKRALRAQEIVPRLRQALQKHTALEWEEIFGDRAPCCAVRSLSQMFTHPQTVSEGLVADVEHPRVGRYKALANPVKFSSQPGPDPRAAPALGEHAERILRNAGYSADEIAELRKVRAIV